MITAELRRAILDAAGASARGEDPRLRPGPAPGSYTTALPFRLPPDPRTAATELAARLGQRPWIATASPAGPGFVTVTVTHETLARLALEIPGQGPACAASDALAGQAIPEPPPAAAGSWPQARATLAAELTARLATAAGARIYPERLDVPAPLPLARGPRARAAVAGTPAQPSPRGPVADAVAWAGPDAIRYALARTPPGGAPPDPAEVARHVLENPAYAVRYAHAAAAAVLRWAAALGIRPAGFTPRLLAEPGELALLDALSWLPERVATAARRGRPDEFAGYLAELAAKTIDTMGTSRFTKIADISSERLWLADAARTGLAAGLSLLGIDAPSRL